MNIIRTSIFTIMERFPERAEVIKRLFSENDDFQTVCEDYHQCSKALRYWNQSMETDAPTRKQEYMGLLRELEHEIVQRLNEAA